MNEPVETGSPSSATARAFPADGRAARILAKAIYKEARGAGMEGASVIAVATELIGLVTEEMRAARS